MNNISNNRISIIDGHNDYLSWCIENNITSSKHFLSATDPHSFSYPNLTLAGLISGFFALWTMKEWCTGVKQQLPHGFTISLSKSIDRDIASKEVNTQYSLLIDIIKSSNNKVSLVRNINDLMLCLTGDRLGVILHMEGAEPLCPRLTDLSDWYNKGLRSLGLTWARANAFGNGAPYFMPGDPDQGAGLTDNGINLVKACNALGILVDVAHLNGKGFWDVYHASSKPFVSTHTGCHKICPSSRNLTDEQILAIKDKEGLIGITFSVTELRRDGLSIKQTPPDILIEHILHVCSVAGIEYVAFGSDYCGGTLPSELEHVLNIRILHRKLLEAGLTTLDLEHLCYKNWLRVLKKVWL
ncbi:MAG: membrane dipeptidase [Deltaproteobacteria bacterium]|nr:membrane dipeptidase [Deltaproteobacteria bacterium]